MGPPPLEGILIIGEIIRMKMHKDPLLVKDRRYHLRTYPSCFVGKDVVEWLLKNGEAQSASNAIACMKILQNSGIFHHVCDDHMFKNEYLFYRFRIDDGTFFVDTEYENFHEAIMIHQRILGDSSNDVMEEVTLSHNVTLLNCFRGSKFVTWLLSNNITVDRKSGVEIGRQFIDMMVIKEVPPSKNPGCFMDDDTIYRFIFDIDAPLPLYRALNISSEDSHYTKDLEDYMRASFKEENGRKYMARIWKGDAADEPNDHVAESSDTTSALNDTASNLKPVILRDVTVKELMSKESPYHWKNVKISSDAVGYGFVIRGDGPCYVQAVDPSGPAAAAGLKVRMFIFSVNGKNVLSFNHNEVAKMIMQGVVVDLVVLQNFRASN